MSCNNGNVEDKDSLESIEETQALFKNSKMIIITQSNKNLVERRMKNNYTMRILKG